MLTAATGAHKASQAIPKEVREEHRGVGLRAKSSVRKKGCNHWLAVFQRSKIKCAGWPPGLGKKIQFFVFRAQAPEICFSSFQTIAWQEQACVRAKDTRTFVAAHKP